MYLLGHEELQAAAIRYLGNRLAGYHERLHAWAAATAPGGWPAETPEYLLGGYYPAPDDLGDLTPDDHDVPSTRPGTTGCST